MSKTNKIAPKIQCERYKRHLRAFNSFEKNIYRTVKRVVISKKTCSSREDKSFSTCVLSSCRRTQVTTPKRTAKSDVFFNQELSCKILDHCKNCGDVAPSVKYNSKSVINKPEVPLKSNSNCNSLERVSNMPTTTTCTTVNKNNRKSKLLQQYYRNENFFQSTDSFYTTENIKKLLLNTIIEHPEKSSVPESRTINKVSPEDSEDELCLIDPDNTETLENLKQFRKKNFFECHSAKSRIHSKGSVTSLNDHKCVYRFYLNDRLFPVPLNTDYKQNIRCVECHLPFEDSIQNSNINGTIQAKVKLNGDIQDMLLMLPVNNSLIVKERRKILPVNKKNESLYFGIIKLDINGDSIFNRNLPSDSLALRYQKGYKELSINKKYQYESVNQDDIIII